MNPDLGPDYGKMHDEKDLEKLVQKSHDKIEAPANPPKTPIKDWPRFAIGEILPWKGHIWRVQSISKSGGITIYPIRPETK